MNIIITDILDSNMIDNSDSSKIAIMNDLIEHFAPMFYEDLRKKQKQLKSNETDVSKLKSMVKRNKTVLIKLDKKRKKEKIKKQILEEIQYLSTLDVLYGKNKVTVQSIVSAIDKLDLDGLEKRLNLLHRLVKTKRG